MQSHLQAGGGMAAVGGARGGCGWQGRQLGARLSPPRPHAPEKYEFAMRPQGCSTLLLAPVFNGSHVESRLLSALVTMEDTPPESCLSALLLT